MALGPIELIVLSFPGNQFNGAIIPELERLVESGTITIVDGVLVSKDALGEVIILEISEAGLEGDAARLADLIEQVESLISESDVDELAAALEPESSTAMLVFEHTWAKPFRDAVVQSGGILTADIRIPGMVVNELMAELAQMD